MQKRTIWKGFFVLEGLDGSGTSTQLQLIAGEYRRRNIPALATWEPSDLPIGRLIRRILGHEEQVHPGAL
ncbi:MAG: dTMP kinase, partial [Spirochaetales bacterium]|nr:dTMP kinase [Spirochaetales bacterium]